MSRTSFLIRPLVGLLLVAGCIPIPVSELADDLPPSGPTRPPVDPNDPTGTQTPFSTSASTDKTRLVFEDGANNAALITVEAQGLATICWPIPRNTDLLRLQRNGTDVVSAGADEFDCDPDVVRSARTYLLRRAPSAAGETVDVVIVVTPSPTDLPGPPSPQVRERITLEVVRPESPLTVSISGPGQVNQGEGDEEGVTYTATIRGGNPFTPTGRFFCSCGNSLGREVDSNDETAPYCVIWKSNRAGLEIAGSVAPRPLPQEEAVEAISSDTAAGTAESRLVFFPPTDDEGVVELSITVCDSKGNATTETRPVLVVPPTGLVVNTTASASTIHPGGTVTVTATPVGGTASAGQGTIPARPYCLTAVVEGPAGVTGSLAVAPSVGRCGSANRGFRVLPGRSLEMTFQAPLNNAHGETNTIVVTATDATGAQAQTNRLISMFSDFDLLVSAVPSSLVPGAIATVTATVVGGLDGLGVFPAGGALYSYSFDSGNRLRGVLSGRVFNTNQATQAVTYTAPAIPVTDTLEVIVTDISGRSVSRTVPIVIGATSPLEVDLNVSEATVAIGATITLVANVRGNIGSPTFVWTVKNNSTGVTSPLPGTGSTNTWTATGVNSGDSFTFTVVATDPGRNLPDDVDDQASQTITIDTSCGPPPELNTPAPVPPQNPAERLPPLSVCLKAGLAKTQAIGPIPFDDTNTGTPGQTFYWIELKPELAGVATITVTPPEATPAEFIGAALGEITFGAGAHAALQAVFGAGVGDVTFGIDGADPSNNNRVVARADCLSNGGTSDSSFAFRLRIRLEGVGTVGLCP